MHVVQLHRAVAALPQHKTSQIHICVISFATRTALRTWHDQVLLPELAEATFFSFASDSSLAAYHAYGLGRNSPHTVYGPRILWHYALLRVRGRSLPKSKQDALQRGGDFVVGSDGALRFSHTGRDQSERPHPDAILHALMQ